MATDTIVRINGKCYRTRPVFVIDPTPQWEAAIAAQQAAGLSRSAAIQTVMTADAALYDRYERWHQRQATQAQQAGRERAEAQVRARIAAMRKG